MPALYENQPDIIVPSIIPPMVPSHVFFGEIFESGVLPINEPTI